ncbi:MAG: hypothetical protein UHX00_15390 [Caryophanon sp.]|nr:hypothetical protein [Caryophanon sp.]
MIYVPLANELLEKHKHIGRKDGTLYNNLTGLLDEQRNEISEPILTFIIGELESIVSCNFEEMQKLQQKYLQLIYSLESHFQVESSKQQNKIALKKFSDVHEKISQVFLAAYNRFTNRNTKKWNSYIFLRQLNQNVCPYCNANFIHTIQASNTLKTTGSRAMADLDHFLPKSIFPIFAITLSNLVPSCIYCNQRFKSDYYTSLARNFSPYDATIEENIRFKIVYHKRDFKSIWQKLEQFNQATILSKEERYYIKLLAIKDKCESTEETYEEQCLYFLQGKNEVTGKKEDLAVNAIFNVLETTSSNKLEHKEVARKYRNQVECFIELKEDEKVLQKEQYVNTLTIFYDDINLKFKEYINVFRERNETQLLNIRALKKKIIKHFEDTQKAYTVEISVNVENDFKKVDFVDVTLGKSFNYQIEIEATGEKEDQYKVYNNAALFQLEAVYNEYRGYINRKIEQSYILNDLYKAQLHEQFPTLFPHTIDSMTNTFFTKKEDLRHEVLGKLVHDIVVPTVKAGRMELLDL